MPKRKPRSLPGSPGPLRVPPRILTTQTVPVVIHPRRWPKVTGIVVAAALVIGGVVFALTSFVGPQSSGGERTPEAAVEKFVQSANQGDLLGVLDMLAPLERSGWRKPMQQFFVDGRRLRIIPNAVDVASLDGLRLDLHAAAEPAELVAPDVAAVNVGGLLSSTLEIAGTNPIGTAERNVNLRVAAVRSGTRWFVSLWHTVAENLRFHSTRALTWPSKQSAVTNGSATPIEAVSKLLGAVERLSLGDLIAVLDPEEAGVLQRVAPWFLPGTQQAIDDAVRRGGLNLRLSDPQYVATTKGNNATVRFTGLQAVVKSNHLGIAIHDNCGVFSSYGEADTRQCLGDAEGTRDTLGQQLLRLGLEPVIIRGVLLYDDVRRALEGLEGAGVAVHNVGGQWYVDPTRTVADLALAVLGNSERSLGETMADDVRALVRLLQGGAPTESVPGATSTGPSGFAGPAGEPGAVDTYGKYTQCLALNKFDDAKACIDTGILNGEIDRSMVDGSFLYPECGWRGSRFDPSLPAMSNEPYVRLATAAAKCMQAKVDAGLLLPVQVPFELVKVECLHGTNPSRMGPGGADAYLQCQFGDR